MRFSINRTRGRNTPARRFQRLLADNGITRPLTALCGANACRAMDEPGGQRMESVFSSLKTERTARKVYRTRDEARADVFDYIERFSNPRRRHSKLGYLSPMEFEARAMRA